MPNTSAPTTPAPAPELWSSETKLNPVPPAPLVVIASLVIGAILFLVGGLFINNRLPNNPQQPVIDQGGAQPDTGE